MNPFSQFFGWIASTKEQEDINPANVKAIAPEQNDGSIVLTKSGQYDDGDASGMIQNFTTSMDLDPLITSEQALITKYRELSLQPEIDKAVEIIVNEAISVSDKEVTRLNLDRLQYSESLKKIILDEYEHVIEVLDFNANAFEIFKRWYIDGRLQYQVVVDKENYQNEGIHKLVYLDPRKLKKVRVIKKQKDPKTGIDLFVDENPHYLYSEHGFVDDVNSVRSSGLSQSNISITNESVVQVTSGLLDPTNSVVLSYLHKAIRSANQLKSLEDATMVYKLSRAPERRIFYIDVGNLPPAKAEQVLRKQMDQYRTKMIYDINTGSVRSDSKQMTMIEDFWLPRRSNGRATEISTLPAGQLAGNMGELDHFLNKLYNALNVPVSRMDPSTGFTFGKTTEITRDEVALTKFVTRLRRRFSNIILDLLQRQLALKNIVNPNEFSRIRQLLTIEYTSDNHFDEMLATEIRETRLNSLNMIAGYTLNGSYNFPLFSKEYIYKEILMMSDEEIQKMQKQLETEAQDELSKQQEQQSDNEEQGQDEDQDQDSDQQKSGPRTVVHQADVSTKLNNIRKMSNQQNRQHSTTTTTQTTQTQQQQTPSGSSTDQ